MNQGTHNNVPAVERGTINPNRASGGVSFNFGGTGGSNIFIFQNPGNYTVNMQSGATNGLGNGQPLGRMLPTPTHGITSGVVPYVDLGERILGTSSAPVGPSFTSGNKSASSTSLSS